MTREEEIENLKIELKEFEEMDRQCGSDFLCRRHCIYNLCTIRDKIKELENSI